MKEENPGIDVLNTGYGDFELRFNPKARPRRSKGPNQTITDMLKRGYAIFVRQGKETFRVRKFDMDRTFISSAHARGRSSINGTRATAVGRSAGG